MRVLYLTMNPNRASTTVPTEGWFRVLRPLGLEPVLASNTKGTFHNWAVDQGIPAYQIPIPVPDEFNAWSLIRSLWRLRKLVKRHRIQIIHCNEHDVYPVGQYLARLCKLPVAVSVHFTMDRGFCEWAFTGSRRPDRLFFISGGSREACRDAIEGIVPKDHWRLLPNGLDLEHFRPDNRLRESFRNQHGLRSALVMGVACALRPRKQLEHLFKAVENIDVPGVRLLLAGSAVKGDETYADDLLKKGKAKLGEKLVYVGHLNELRGFYNTLDLFVNTSQEEACSISVIEALACGCPVIGYASKSVDEQVLPNGGEIVEQDGIEQLTVALRKWLNDPVRLHEGRTLARQTAEDRFDIKHLSMQLWKEYLSLLGRKDYSRLTPLPASTASLS
ncbi:MAG: glycosyltransferase family 4 protein [Gemmataceae bacterium]